MAIIIDGEVLYAAHLPDAHHHEVAKSALTTVTDGGYGDPTISETIFDQAVILAIKESGHPSIGEVLADKLRGVGPYDDRYRWLEVTPPVYTDSLAMLEETGGALSFTDATTVALCEQHGIESVLSFNSDFDPFLDRVAPATV